MKTVEMLGWWLVVVGALNWGLVGLGWLVGGGADWNLVHMLVGAWPMLEGLVYVLVGASGAWMLWKKLAGGKK